jgi:hypothetical protein
MASEIEARVCLGRQSAPITSVTQRSVTFDLPDLPKRAIKAHVHQR